MAKTWADNLINAGAAVREHEREHANLITLGVRMKEVDLALMNHLHETRGVSIGESYGFWHVFPDNGLAEMFSSASYTACLEFALKLPVIEK